MLPRTRHHLTGPPVALPVAFDRVAETWWRARPRTRMLLGVSLVALALMAGLAHAAAAPGGPPTSVWVATRDLLPGEVIAGPDTERRSWPMGLVPDGAVARPTGTVTATLPRGAVVTDRHLGELGIVAAVAPGRVAVAVPVDQLPTLSAGARLDLVGPAPDGGGTLLAVDATVVASDGQDVWLSIDPEAALEVSSAVAGNAIAAVVHPPDG
jgi:hypothetical protein